MQKSLANVMPTLAPSNAHSQHYGTFYATPSVGLFFISCYVNLLSDGVSSWSHVILSIFMPRIKDYIPRAMT